MPDTPQLIDIFEESNKKTAQAVIERKLLSILREAYGDQDTPLNKREACRLLCNHFRLTKMDAYEILVSLNRDGAIVFEKCKKVSLQLQEQVVGV